MLLHHPLAWLPIGFQHQSIMSRSLYSPKLSDDVVRALYREGQRRRMPMTRLADDLLRRSLGSVAGIQSALHIREEEPEGIPIRKTDAA